MINSDEDVWGGVCGDDTVFYLFNGAGLKFAEIDDNGYIQYQFGDEDSIVTMKKIFDDVMYADWYNNTFVDKNHLQTKIFEADHCLFAFGLVKSVNGYRNMESDYCVLPIPKLSTDQENYSSLVWMHHDCVLGIPENVGDAEMVSVILEALSAEAYYTVYPAFYDTVIMGKSVRDQQSKDMLKIVFETRSFDPGQYWDNGTGVQGELLRLTSKGTSDIASIWARCRSAVEKCFNEINDKIG